MDVAQLQVAVTSTGIQETSSALGGLGRSADNAATKVDKLVSSVEKLISKNIDLSSATAKATQMLTDQKTSFSNLMTATDQTVKSMMQVVEASQKLTDALSTLNTAQAKSIAGFEQSSKWGNVFTSTLKAMATATLVYKGAQLAENMVETADKFTTLNARLRIVTGSQHDATVAMDKLFDAAQRSRQPLEDMTTLFARMDPAIKKMGGDSQETVQIVVGAANALKLYGASSKEAQGAILQLSHAMASGQLNGREYNAMAQEGRPLLDALLVGYNKLHPAAQRYFADLKEMVTKHEVGPQDLVEGIKLMGAEWQKQVDSMPITFADAFTRVKNVWFKSIGEMNMATGFNQELGKALDILQELIPEAIRGIGDAFISITKWIDKNRDGIEAVWNQVKGLAVDVWSMVGSWFKIYGEISEATDGASLLSDALLLVRLAVASISDGLKVVVGSLLLAAGYTEKIALAGRINHAGWTKEDYQNQKDRLEVANHLVDVGKSIFNGLVEQGSAVDNILQKEKERIALRQKEKEETAREAFRHSENLGGFQGGAGKPDPKTESAEEIRKAQEELQKYENELQKIVVSQREATLTLQAMDEFGIDYEKMTEGQKLVLKYQYELNEAQKAGATTKHLNHLQDLIDMAQGQATLEAMVQQRKQQLEDDKKSLDHEDTVISTLKRESDALQDKINNYHQLAGAVESVHIAETQQAIDALKSKGTLSKFEQDMLDKLEQELALRNKIQSQKVQLGDKQAQAELDKWLDPKKAQKFGDVLKDAFGGAGKALGALLDSFTKYEERQKEVAAAEANLAQLRKDGKDVAADEAAINQKATDYQLSSIAEITGATKDFFDKKTAAYKTLDGIEKAYRAMEIADEVKAFAQKSGLLTAFTSLFVTSKATEAAADTTATGVAVSNNMIEGQSSAVVAVANQGKGDPYSAWIRMAAMAAVMAGLGFIVGGGRFGSTQDAPTYNTGTGTVLGGSATDTSKSIENSISDLKGIDSMTMKYSAQMAASLQNIEAELGGVANLVFQGGTLNTGNNLGINQYSVKNTGDPLVKMSTFGLINDSSLTQHLPILGNLVNGLQSLWGKTTQEISAAGVAINGTLQQLMQGLGMQQFADVKTTSSSWFGLKKNTSYNTQTAALDPEMKQQFALIFSSFTDEVGQAAQALGMPLSDIQNKLNGFVLNLGKIDLKGLSGKDLQDRLAAVFGAAGDQIAKAAIPGLEAFQKVGEGYLETVTRVASGYEQAKVALDGLGISMVGLSSVINKQGDVGAELVRQSIEVKEAGSGVGKIMDTLTGSASDLVSAYKTLVDLRNQMDAVGLGTNLTTDLIAAAGGVQEMGSALKAYSQNFFSDSERQAAAVKQLAAEFSALGLQMPTTKDAFRSLVDQLEGQGKTSLAMQVIGLADAFSQVADASASAQAVKDAQTALSDAYNKQKQDLTSTKTAMDNFTQSISDFRNKLLTGSLSPLSPEEKYATISQQYESVAQAAMSGNQDAISQYQTVAEQFLQASQQYNASGDQYMQDFQKVLDESQAIMTASEGQSTIAQQQLDALDQQVSGLIQINTSVLTVTQAIENLQAAMTANAITPPVTTSTGGAPASSTTPNASIQPVVSGLDALAQQVSGLSQVIVQTSANVVAATYDSNEQNAQTIVNGTNNALQSGGYSQSRVPVALA
jgi:tape measure domain-containing protein